jgi:hypothetical protein
MVIESKLSCSLKLADFRSYQGLEVLLLHRHVQIQFQQLTATLRKLIMNFWAPYGSVSSLILPE